MKKLILLSPIFLASTCVLSQIHTLVNHEFDLSSITPDGQNDELTFDLDQDGTIDISIKSWFNHTVGTQSMISLTDIGSNSNWKIPVDSCGYLMTCQNAFNFVYSAGFLYNTDNCTNTFNGSVDFPFYIKNGTVPCVMLVVFEPQKITIPGISAFMNCGSLGIDKIDLLTNNEPVECFNLLGQKSDKGILISVDKLGVKKIVFKE